MLWTVRCRCDCCWKRWSCLTEAYLHARKTASTRGAELGASCLHCQSGSSLQLAHLALACLPLVVDPASLEACSSCCCGVARCLQLLQTATASGSGTAAGKLQSRCRVRGRTSC